MLLRRPIALLTVLCMLLPVGATHATLVSLDDAVFGAGALTQDSATGFQWLDLTLTGVRSYNDMVGNDGSNEFVAGGDFAGFRYATLTEVEQLWLAAGIAPSHIYHESPACHRSVRNQRQRDVHQRTRTAGADRLCIDYGQSSVHQCRWLEIECGGVGR